MNNGWCSELAARGDNNQFLRSGISVGGAGLAVGAIAAAGLSRSLGGPLAGVAAEPFADLSRSGTVPCRHCLRGQLHTRMARRLGRARAARRNKSGVNE